MLSSHLILCHLPASFSCPQSLPASGSFPVNLFFTSCGQSIGALASALVLSVNIQCWFPLGMTGLISLESKGLSSLLQHHNSKASILLLLSLLYGSVLTSIHDCWIALTIQTFVNKVMSLLFYTLSRFVIAFLPRTRRLLILWLQSPSLVILEQRK